MSNHAQLTLDLAALQQRVAALETALAESQQALAASQAVASRYLMLINHAREAIISLDEQQRITMFNPAAEHMFGYTAAQALGQSLDILFPPGVAELHRQHVADFLASPDQARSMGSEWRVISGQHRDGPLFTADATLTKFKQAEQTTSTVYLHDITERRQAEAKLRESEETARALINASPDVVVLLDPQGTILALNEVLARRLGQPLDAIVGRNLYEILPPEVAQARKKFYDQAVQTGQPVQFEDENRGVFFESHVYPVLDSTGAVMRLAVYGHNVTERRRIQEALQVSEASFQTLFANNPHPMWVYDRQTLAFLEVNEAAIDHYGYSRAEFLRMNALDIRTPGEGARLRDYMGRSHPDLRRAGHWQHRLKDGRFIEVEINSHVINFAGREAVLVVSQDITARLQAEAKLRESEERFRQMTENIDQVFWIFEMNDLAYINPAYEAVWGRTCQSLYENSFSFMESIHPNDQARLNRAIEQQHQGQRTEIEYRVVRPDGSMRWVVDRGFPILDEQGRVYRIAGIATDITDRRQAELALQQRTQEYETLVENVPDIIQRFDRSLRTIYINSAFTKTFGIPAETLLNKTLREQGMTVEQTELMEQAIYHVFDTGQPSMVIVKFDPPGSSVVYHQIRYAPELSADGAVETVLAVGRDVTELKQAQAAVERLNRTLEARVEERTAALQESEARYRLLADNASDMIALHDLDTAIRYVSPSVKDILGYEPEALIGVMPMRLLHPDDAKRLGEDIRTYLATGQMMPNLAYRLRRADGSYVWIETYSRPIINDAGQITQLQSSSRDITARKQAEESLRASEARYRLLADSSQDIIALHTPNGTIEYISPSIQWLLGYQPEELLGKSSYHLTHPDDLAQMQEGIRQQIAAGIVDQTLEFRLQHQADHYLWLETKFRLIFDAAGQVTQIRTASRDITERKRMEYMLRQNATELSLANAELERAARLKDEFLASMSHELRTPLTAILGQSEVLQEEIYGPVTPEQHQALTDIQTSGQHLLTLINDLLDLSKIEAGKLELDVRPVSVAGVCQSSLRFIKNQAHKKEIAVTFVHDEVVEIVQADERRLKQILVNLLSNAVKFTPAGGAIGLEVQGDVAQHEVHLTVWDTGIGIAAEHMERLFKPFVQLDSRLSRQYAGTGLGLALVARLSQMHGGRVSLQSEVGQGSRFTVSLPWLPAEQTWRESGDIRPVDANKPAPAAGAEFATLPALILLAEDNDNVSRLLLDYLANNGYRSALARSGQQVLDQVSRERPALILMDVQMPGMDGLETTRRLRANPDSQVAAIPIIALTALTTPEDREICLAAGANDYLSKPLRLKELIKTIKAQLGR